MRKRLVERVDALRSVEHGFTLLELLIAIVVLSILMATASQYYLHQRRKAWEAQVRASVRNMAGAQNHFVFAEGAPTFTKDLDDLYLVGYRWNERSVRPYVALATNQTYCIQVHSAHDPTIVWHFSSNVGHPQPGPATPADCGDPDVLGLYIAGLPPESAGRDGVLSTGGDGTPTASTPFGSSATRDGNSSVEEGEFGGPGGSTTPGTGSGEDSSTTGSTPGYGTTDPTSGTVPGDTSGTTTTTDGCSGGGTGSGSTTGTNHPSGHDRGDESGGSGDQGSSGSDPDGDQNDGADKPGEDGGANTGDQDGNNGSGNDTDFEDDNRGPDQDGTATPGSNCS